MEFVDHGFGPRATWIKRCITQRGGIDDFTRLADIFGLKAGGGIGDDKVSVHPELISRADMSGRTQRLVPSIVIMRHAARRAADLKQFDKIRRRRPKIERHAVVDDLRPMPPELFGDSQTRDHLSSLSFTGLLTIKAEHACKARSCASQGWKKMVQTATRVTAAKPRLTSSRARMLGPGSACRASVEVSTIRRSRVVAITSSISEERRCWAVCS